jgi:hypothetical protein
VSRASFPLQTEQVLEDGVLGDAESSADGHGPMGGSQDV